MRLKIEKEKEQEGKKGVKRGVKQDVKRGVNQDVKRGTKKRELEEEEDK